MKKKTTIFLLLVLVITCSALTIKIQAGASTPYPVTTGILLNSHFVNTMKVGEVGWVIMDENSGSTGYMWGFTPDLSGTYRLVEEIRLHASVGGAVGVSGKHIWKFKAIRKGNGGMMFELVPPGKKKPVETIIFQIMVK